MNVEHPNKVCRLIKSLYGLKQAGRAWRTALEDAPHCMGFAHLRSDPCMFVRIGDPSNMIRTYVDDGCMTGSYPDVIQRPKR